MKLVAHHPFSKTSQHKDHGEILTQGLIDLELGAVLLSKELESLVITSRNIIARLRELRQLVSEQESTTCLIQQELE